MLLWQLNLVADELPDVVTDPDNVLTSAGILEFDDDLGYVPINDANNVVTPSDADTFTPFPLRAEEFVDFVFEVAEPDTDFGSEDNSLSSVDPLRRNANLGAVGAQSYTIENAGAALRTEVAPVMVVLPQAAASIRTVGDLAPFHFDIVGSKQLIGIGFGSISVLATTILGPVAGYVIEPGTLRIETVVDLGSGEYVNVDVYDNGSGAISGDGITSATINYNTGALAITFAGPVTLNESVTASYRFAESIQGVADWHVMQYWPSASIRRARAWVGSTGGTGIPLLPRDPLTLGPTRMLMEVVFAPDRTSLLPTFTPDSSITTMLSSGTFTSRVTDRNLNTYEVDMTSTPYEEDILEDTAWAQTVRRRSYHAPTGTNSSTLDRDFFSLTWYITTFHGSKRADVEVRLGNDYRGADAKRTAREVVLGVGDGSTATFSTTIDDHVSSHGGLLGQIRRGSVRLSAGTGPVYRDTTDDADDTIGSFEDASPAIVDSHIDYVSGEVSVTFSTAGIPASQVPVVVTYETQIEAVYTGKLGQTSATGSSLSFAPAANSVFVFGGSGDYKLRDNGIGQLVPIEYVSVVNIVGDSGSGASTYNFSLPHENIIPGSVRVRLGNTLTSALWTKDDGVGGLEARNVFLGTGTVDYALGELVVNLSAPLASGTDIYLDYGYTVSAHATGTVDYETGDIDVSFPGPLAHSNVYVSAVENTFAGTSDYDPNDFPLGPVPFFSWGIDTDDTEAVEFHVEGKASYRSVVSTSGNTRTALFASQNFYDPTKYIPTGGFNAVIDEGESLKDGSSLARFFSIYADTADASFTAHTYNRVFGIPTVDTLYATRALGLFETQPKWVTPKQLTPTKSVTAATENLARRSPSLDLNAILQEKSLTAETVGGYMLGVPTGVYGVSTYRVAPIMQLIGSAANDYGARGSLKYWENFPQPEVAKLTRHGHTHAAVAYYAESSIGATYFYHAALFSYTRPGSTAWGLEPEYEWDRSGYYRPIEEEMSQGFIPNGALTHGQHWRRSNQDSLGRSYRKAFGVGLLEVTNGSDTVYFTYGAGDENSDLPTWWSDYEVTFDGATQQAGLRRLAVQGRPETYRITSIAYDTSVQKWAATLDTTYAGLTATNKLFALCNDPEPGNAVINPCTDYRDYSRARVGTWHPKLQHGITGEPSSFPSTDTAYEAWELTGSWLLHDRVVQNGNYWLANIKDNSIETSAKDEDNQPVGGFLANAQALKNILSAYLLTQVSDPASAARYQRWVNKRHGWWLRTSAKGYMDGSTKGIQVTRLGKEIAKDCKVATMSGLHWGDAWRVGPATTIRGITDEFLNSTISVTQGIFGELGFSYSPVWAVSYHVAYLWAAARQFRNASLTATEGVPLSSALQRIAEGTTSFLLDYAVVADGGNHPLSKTNPMYATTPDLASQFAPGYIVVNLGRSTINGDQGSALQAFAEAIRSGWTARNMLGDWRREDRVVDVVESDYPDSEIAVVAWEVRCGTPQVRDLPEFPADGDPYIDTMGWPVPGTERINSGRSLDSDPRVTSFELGAPDSGVINSSYIVPGCTSNDPANYFYPCYRPPHRIETYLLWGHSYNAGHPTEFNAAFAPALAMSMRFHSDVERRSQSSNIINGWVHNAMALSQLRGNINGKLAESTGLKIEYEDRLLGVITASPFSTTGTWWDSRWRYRRKLRLDSEHSGYTACDVLSISAQSLIAHSQTTLNDIRVIRQTPTGFFPVEHTVRFGINGPVLFVKPGIEIGAGDDINSVEQSFYVYYGSPAAEKLENWTNTKSINGPYAVTTDTHALWNQQGSIYTDAGPFGADMEVAPGPQPLTVEGPFGSALRVTVDSNTGGGGGSAVQTMRVGNFTPFERVEVVLCNLTLAPGTLSDANAATVKLWAVDPLLDGSDYPVEWHAFGPKNGADDSYRCIRAYLPVRIAAGTPKAQRTDAMQHPYFSMRDIEFYLSPDTSSIPTFSEHPSLNLAGVFTSMQLTVQSSRRIFIASIDPGDPGDNVIVTTRNPHCLSTGDDVNLVNGLVPYRQDVVYSVTKLDDFRLRLDSSPMWHASMIATGNGTQRPPLDGNGLSGASGVFYAPNGTYPMESSRWIRIRRNQVIATGTGTTTPTMANGHVSTAGTTQLDYFPIQIESNRKVKISYTDSVGAKTAESVQIGSGTTGNIVLTGTSTVIAQINYRTGEITNFEATETIPASNKVIVTEYYGGNSFAVWYEKLDGTIEYLIDEPDGIAVVNIGTAVAGTIPNITRRIAPAPFTNTDLTKDGAFRILATKQEGGAAPPIVAKTISGGRARLVNNNGNGVDVGIIDMTTGEIFDQRDRTPSGGFLEFSVPLQSGTPIQVSVDVRGGTLYSPSGNYAGTVDYQTGTIKDVKFDAAPPASTPIFASWRELTAQLSQDYFVEVSDNVPSITKSFDLNNAALRDYVDGTPITTSRASLELDASPVGATGKWTKAYRIPVRIYPEYDDVDGDVDRHPTTWGNFYFDVASSTTGYGRFVKFWFEFGVGLVTDDYYKLETLYKTSGTLSATLTPHPIEPGTLRIQRRGFRQDDYLAIVDDGLGNLSGPGVASGSINYETGRLTVVFDAHVSQPSLFANTTNIQVRWVRAGDEPPRAPWLSFVYHDTPKLRIVGPRVVVTNDQLDKGTISASYDSGSGKWTTDIPIRMITSNEADRNANTTVDGEWRIIEGVMLYESGITAGSLEDTTRNAILFDGSTALSASNRKPGYQAVMTPVSKDWLANQDNFSAFGAVPEPPKRVNGVTLTEADLLYSPYGSGVYCHDDYTATYYRDPWKSIVRHGLSATPPQAGSQSDFGMNKFHYIYQTAFPDVRGPIIWAYREHIRYVANRDKNNLPLDPGGRIRDASTGMPQDVITSAIAWNSRTQGTGNAGLNWIHGLGARWDKGSAMEVPDFPGRPEFPNTFYVRDNLHYSANCIASGVTLVPHRCAYHSIARDCAGNMLRHLPDPRVSIFTTSVTSSWSTPGPWRDEGRVGRSAAQAYWMTGDSRFAKWHAARALYLWENGQRGTLDEPHIVGSGSNYIAFRGDLTADKPLRIAYTDDGDPRTLSGAYYSGPFSMIAVSGIAAGYRVIANEPNAPEYAAALVASAEYVKASGGSHLIRGLVRASTVNAELDRRNISTNCAARISGEELYWVLPYAYAPRTDVVDPAGRMAAPIHSKLPKGLQTNKTLCPNGYPIDIHNLDTDLDIVTITNSGGGLRIDLETGHGYDEDTVGTVVLSNVKKIDGTLSSVNGTHTNAIYQASNNFKRVFIPGVTIELNGSAPNWDGVHGVATVNPNYPYWMFGDSGWNRWGLGGLMYAAYLMQGETTEGDLAIREKLGFHPIFPSDNGRAWWNVVGSSATLRSYFGTNGDSNWYSWATVPNAWSRWLVGNDDPVTGGARVSIPYTASVFAPPSDFTIDFQLRVRLVDWIFYDSISTWAVLSSLSSSPTTQDPIEAYIDTTTKEFVFRLVIGGVVHDLRIDGPTIESEFFAGNGSTRAVSYNFGTTIVPGTLSIASTDRIFILGDDGDGNITGSGVVSGTIDYATGALSMTLAVAVAASESLTAAFIESGTDKWNFDDFFSVKVAYSESQSTIGIQINGSEVDTTTVIGGGILPVTNPGSIVTVGSLTEDPDSYTPIDIAEIRIEGSYIPDTCVVETPAEPYYDDEELLVVTGESTAAVSAYVGGTNITDNTARVEAFVAYDRSRSAAVSAFVILGYGEEDAIVGASVSYERDEPAAVSGYVAWLFPTEDAAVGAWVEYDRTKEAGVFGYVVVPRSEDLAAVSATVQVIQSESAAFSATVVPVFDRTESAVVYGQVQVAPEEDAAVAATVVVPGSESAAVAASVGVLIDGPRAAVRSYVGVDKSHTQAVRATVQVAPEEDAVVSATVRVTGDEDAAVVAYVGTNPFISARVSSYIQQTSTKSESAAARAWVEFDRTLSAVASAFVVIPASEDAEIYAQVQAFASEDAVISGYVLETFAADESAVVSASVGRNVTLTAARIAATVQAARSASAAVRANVKGITTQGQPAAVVAWVRVLGEADAVVSATVVAASTEDAVVSAYVVEAYSEEAVVSGFVAASIQAYPIAVSAYVVSNLSESAAVSATVALTSAGSARARVKAYVIIEDDVLEGETRPPEDPEVVR